MTDETQCRMCGHEYELREGCEPTPFCDECAHKQVEILDREIELLKQSRSTLAATEQRVRVEANNLRAKLAALQSAVDRVLSYPSVQSWMKYPDEDLDLDLIELNKIRHL